MQLLKLRVSFGVIGFLVRKIVKAPVKLNNDTRTCNIEINDEISDILLPVDGHGQSFKKIVPKVLFLGSHSFSQRLRRSNKLFVVIVDHGSLNGSPFFARYWQKS